MVLTQLKKAKVMKDVVGKTDENLSKILTSNQCYLIIYEEKVTKRNIRYSADTVERARLLRDNCGFTTYLNLKNHGFPLPHQRSLRGPRNGSPKKKTVKEENIEDIGEAFEAVGDDGTKEEYDDNQ